MVFAHRFAWRAVGREENQTYQAVASRHPKWTILGNNKNKYKGGSTVECSSDGRTWKKLCVTTCKPAKVFFSDSDDDAHIAATRQRKHLSVDLLPDEHSNKSAADLKNSVLGRQRMLIFETHLHTSLHQMMIRVKMSHAF